MGTLSSKYEARGGAGTVSSGKGDIGGISYGTYQMSTGSGTAQKFANEYGGALKGLKAGTAAFAKAWKAEASGKNAAKFAQAQHEYVKKSHYNPTANKFKSTTGIDVSTRSAALQNALWSIGVQHGSGGANSIFKASGVKSSDSDATILKKLYAERSKVDKYFKSSVASTKASVKKRFQAELNDALAMLNGTYKG